MFKCEVCGKMFSGLEYLQKHLQRIHNFSKKDIEEYYINYYQKDKNEGIDPFSGCKTEFFSLKKGYKKFDNSDISKYYRTNVMTKEYWINVRGYSEKDAIKRIDETKKKISKSFHETNEYDKLHNPNHHLKFSYSKEALMYRGYSEEEAERVSKEAGKKVGEANKKHWKENPERFYGTRTTQKEYWIKKGYTEEEAIQKVKERQRTFTLEKCVEKYGEELGKQKYKERQEQWKKSLQKNFDIFGDGRSPQSKWARDCINKICVELNIIQPNREKYITDKDTKKHYSYDFCYNKKLIEFNGDYWHCNPLMYNSLYFNKNRNLTAQEIWIFDKNKELCAIKNGYEIISVWESEYNENPEKTINKCIEFIKS